MTPFKFLLWPIALWLQCCLVLSLASSFSAVASEQTTLRPGDTLYLSLPGESTLNMTVPIKRNGKLLLPEVGEVYLQGLTLLEANVKVKTLLQEVIHDLDAFELLLKERRLTISVLGYVKKPGNIDLPPGAGIQAAITLAQGLIPGAQLNKMQVRRDGKVHLFDYKYYLDSGDSSKLPELQPLDTIFVPATSLLGNVQVNFDAKLVSENASGGNHQGVQVLGEVRKPGQIDWSENLTLFDLITRAGGPNNSANLANVKILSRDDKGNITSQVFDMAAFIEQGGALATIPQLQPKDTVIVPTVAPDLQNEKSTWLQQSAEESIYVMGEVTAPGRYLFNNKMHFLDILAAAKGPNGQADINNIRITHRNGKTSRVTHLNLGRYFETGDDSLLPKVSIGDVIYIPNKDRLLANDHHDKTVRVLGAVNAQGHYRLNGSMTILDLLAQAGGLSPTAQASNIVVVNGSPCQTDNDTECLSNVSNFNLLDFTQSGDFSQLPRLSSGDTVYVLHKQDSTWNRVLDGIQDTVSVISVLKILGGG